MEANYNLYWLYLTSNTIVCNPMCVAKMVLLGHHLQYFSQLPIEQGNHSGFGVSQQITGKKQNL